MPTRARIERLSEARYKLQLTAGRELRDKLERARDLTRHRNPKGDLAVVERALDALLERLGKERLGKARRPPARRARVDTPREAKTAPVSRAARRQVFERDGEPCTYVDEHDRRCPARTLLELDHVCSRGMAVRMRPRTLRVLCRAHNRHHAEEVFGRAPVATQIHLRSESATRRTDPSMRASTPRRAVS
jgi:hypothetical protein